MVHELNLMTELKRSWSPSDNKLNDKSRDDSMVVNRTGWNVQRWLSKVDKYLLAEDKNTMAIYYNSEANIYVAISQSVNFLNGVKG